MEAQTTAALIGVAGVIAGALITSVGPHLRNRLSVYRTPSDAIGRWSATWSRTDPQTNRLRTLTDEISIKRKAWGRLSGSGEVKFENREVHKYQLEGWESSYALTLAYSGLDMERNLVGVVFLKKTIVNEKMAGHWWQYNKDGEVVGGDTTWTKQ